jgi:hypothetical protein
MLYFILARVEVIMILLFSKYMYPVFEMLFTEALLNY